MIRKKTPSWFSCCFLCETKLPFSDSPLPPSSPSSSRLPRLHKEVQAWHITCEPEVRWCSGWKSGETRSGVKAQASVDTAPSRYDDATVSILSPYLYLPDVPIQKRSKMLLEVPVCMEQIL